MHHQQIELATKLGRLGRLSGRSAPCHCEATRYVILGGRKIGQTPAGEAPTVAVLRAWNAGFAAEHLVQVGLA